MGPFNEFGLTSGPLKGGTLIDKCSMTSSITWSHLACMIRSALWSIFVFDRFTIAIFFDVVGKIFAKLCQ